jgi:glycogen operon protein
MAATVATRICGSADLYQASGRMPYHSVNFITCHDGFTLWDLVSYKQKHNFDNGENNRDGMDENYSGNCGVEGETTDPHILQLRRRQARNLLATLLLSQGVPMLLGGDEVLRSQLGNNNAWCQDNEISWINWGLAAINADFLRFTREMIALRKRHPALRRRSFFRGGSPGDPAAPDIVWHGTDPGRPDFSATGRTLAFALNGKQTGREPDRDFYVACNAWQDSLPFRVPLSPSARPWRRAVDTMLASPLDIVGLDEGPRVPHNSVYTVGPHALVVLISEE